MFNSLNQMLKLSFLNWINTWLALHECRIKQLPLIKRNWYRKSFFLRFVPLAPPSWWRYLVTYLIKSLWHSFLWRWTKMFWYWISDLVAKVRSCTFILLNVFQWDRGINMSTKSGKMRFHKSKIQPNGHYISTIITFLMFNLVDCFSTFLIANAYCWFPVAYCWLEITNCQFL